MAYHRRWAGAHKQRLHFPFRLSRQHYATAAGRARAAALEPLLACPILERFAAGLNEVTYPAQRWQGWHARLDRLLEEGRKVRIVLHAFGSADLKSACVCMCLSLHASAYVCLCMQSLSLLCDCN